MNEVHESVISYGNTVQQVLEQIKIGQQEIIKVKKNGGLDKIRNALKKPKISDQG